MKFRGGEYLKEKSPAYAGLWALFIAYFFCATASLNFARVVSKFSGFASKV